MFSLSYGNPLYDGGGFPTSAAAQDAFVGYATFVGQHYKGAVMRYELWNEWDIGTGVPGNPRGDPIAYTNLLKKVYRALKAIDPNIIVIAGATSEIDLGFAGAVFEAGGLAAMDAWSPHPYVYPDVPELALSLMDTLQDKAKQYTSGKELPMYATEIGWPTYVGTKGVSEPRAAAYVARLYLLAPMHNYLKGIYWYTRIDSGTDPLVLGQHFGLTNFDHTPKASVCAMRQVAQMLASHKPVSATRDERGVWIAKFTSGTSNVFAVWTQDPLATIHSNVSTSAPSGAPITAAGICADINVAGNGSTLLSADITNSPILFTTMADTILVP